jgi:hypothetical protein
MAEKVEYELSLRDLLSSKIDAANASVNRLEKSLGNVKGSAINLGSALGVTFGIAGVVAFTKSVITAGTTVENALTGLTTLLKDAKEAQQVIDNTMDDAQKTPFAFEGLLAANKALISAGTNSKDARQDVLNLANAIAATGGGDNELQRMVVNLQQIKNTGEATALDIKQFAYAGINLYKVLQEAGIKVEKGNKDQKLSYEQITEALKKAHEAGGIYANGLENMAGNTSVKISNLGDAFFQLSVKIFNDLKPAIEAIIGAMFKFIGWLKQGWEWMVKHKEMLKMVATGLGTAWLAFKLISGASAIITAISVALEGMTAAAFGATTSVEAFGAASTFALGPIGLLAAALGLVAAAYYTISDGAEQSRIATQKYLGESKEREKENFEVTLAGYKKIGMSDKKAFDAAVEFEQKNITEMRQSNGFKLLMGGLSDEEKADLSRQQEILKSQQAGLDEVKKRGLVPSKSASKLAASGSSGSKKSGEKNQATGSKSVTINVSIKDLIGTYNMNVTNVKEMGSKVKDIVVQALTGAVNDFQITAGS